MDKSRPQSSISRSSWRYNSVETDIDKSRAQSPASHSSGRYDLSEYCDYTTNNIRSTAFRKYVPFGVHFSLTALVAILVLRVIDGRSFNTNSRRPGYTESDGSISHLTSVAPLQSDITTAVSLAATVTRVGGGWWSGGIIWRCIFVSMERGGISLGGVSQVVKSFPMPPRNFTRRSNQIIIFITLFATFAIDYFSAALTGSIVWESTHRLVPGHIPVTKIWKAVAGKDVSSYFTFPFWPDFITEDATISASLAWGADQLGSTTEPSTRFRRTITQTQYLPVNSTLNNVTVPYFVVDDFEWITDPDSVLKDQQLPLFNDFDKPSPYFVLSGFGGLLPDSEWGPPPIKQLGAPVVISESRLFGFHVTQQSNACPQNFSIDPGVVVNLLQTLAGKFNCYAIANVTYQAGAAICQSCELISPTIVQAHAPLPIISDSFTPMALALAPLVATYFTFSGYAVPKDYGTRQRLVIELTSRSYQAAWASFSDNFGSVADNTTVEIALPTLRARVVPWRVYLWVGLHFLCLTLGLLFVYIQSHCDHPWADDTTMAVFWLNTSALSLELDSQGIDPWRFGAELPRDTILMLEDASECSRFVKTKVT